MSSKVAVVHGAGRGLGLEFVRQLLLRPEARVFACCRQPATAVKLRQLQEQHRDRLTVLALDAADDTSVQAAVQHVRNATQGIHMLVNTVGVLHIPGQMMPETSFSRVTRENLGNCLQANTYAPFLAAQAFYSLLQQGGAAAGPGEPPAVLASLSARVGSLTDNQLGGWYSYRASKAALNMLMKCMAIEAARKKHKVAVIQLHPGTCDTDLSKPFQRNVAPEKLFTEERAVTQLLEILDAVQLSDNGRFIAWDKQDIPW